MKNLIFVVLQVPVYERCPNCGELTVFLEPIKYKISCHLKFILIGVHFNSIEIDKDRQIDICRLIQIKIDRDRQGQIEIDRDRDRQGQIEIDRKKFIEKDRQIEKDREKSIDKD